MPTSLRRFEDAADWRTYMSDAVRTTGVPASLDSADPTEPVLRRDSDADVQEVDLSHLDNLMDRFLKDYPLGLMGQKERAETDRWLAPRLHQALRLHRREA